MGIWATMLPPVLQHQHRLPCCHQPVAVDITGAVQCSTQLSAAERLQSPPAGRVNAVWAGMQVKHQSCQVGVLLSLAPFPPSFPSLSVSLLHLIFLGGSHCLDMSAALFLCIRRHTFGTAGSTGHWKTPCCFPARFSWSAHIWMHYCVHGIVLQGCLSREFPCSSCDLVSSETMSGFLLHCNQWPIPLLYFSILFDYAPNMVSFIHLVKWSNYCAACHAGHLLDLFEVILEDIGDLKTKSFHSSFC